MEYQVLQEIHARVKFYPFSFSGAKLGFLLCIIFLHKISVDLILLQREFPNWNNLLSLNISLIWASLLVKILALFMIDLGLVLASTWIFIAVCLAIQVSFPG